MHKASSNKWVRTKQMSVLNLKQECDSCAAIDGARMSDKHREQIQFFCEQILDIMDKY